MDAEDWDTPQCPLCLEPMVPRVGAWYCPDDDVTVRPED